MTTGISLPQGPPEELARLRRAFAAEGPAVEPCPPAERIFAGAHGELPEAELGALLDHLALCPTCSQEWRLAVELGQQAAPPAAAQPREGGVVVAGNFRQRRVSPWMGLAAALLLAAIGLPFLLRESGPSPALRGEKEVAVVDASGPLDRTSCVLRWRLEPPREGARYAVRAMNEKLEPIADRAGLTAGELALPAEKLARVPPGGLLLWRVEARLADGAVVASPTFRSALP